MSASMYFLCCSLLCSGLGSPAELPLPDAEAHLEAAIRALRGLNPEAVNIDPVRHVEEWRKNHPIHSAQGELACAAGVRRVKPELEALENEGIRDDVFRIVACDILASDDPLEHAELIARALSGVNPWAYSEGFLDMCMRMAKTRRPEVLPCLRHALRIEEGRPFFAPPVLSLTLDWPVVLEHIYGAYGPDAAGDVLKVLESTSREPELRSCLYVLERFRYLPALPAVRALARSGVGRVREDAIFRLGRFACPDDREFLEACLRDSDFRIRYAALAALWELCPPESAPAVAERLWEDESEHVRALAAAVLVRLAEPAALVHCRDYFLRGADLQARDVIEKLSGSFGRPMGAGFRELVGMSLEEFKAASDSRMAEISRTYWELHDEAYTVKLGEPGLSRAQLLAALQEREERESVLGRDGEWLGHRCFAAVAGLGEIDGILAALFRCRARLFERFSDEAFYQARIVDQAIDLMHRRRVAARRLNLWSTVEYAPFLVQASGEREICWWSLLALLGHRGSDTW